VAQECGHDPRSARARAAALEQRGHVEDEHHAPVAEDRGPGDADHGLGDHGVEGLDHHVLLPAKAAHGEPEALLPAAHDHRVGVVAARLAHPEQLREVDERHDAVAHA
jgi:hypothetical protein